MRELLVFFNANWPAGRSTISGKRCSLYTDTTSAIANRRRDFLNKLVSRLIRRYARPGLEDPRITNTVRNYYLVKSSLDTVGTT